MGVWGHPDSQARQLRPRGEARHVTALHSRLHLSAQKGLLGRKSGLVFLQKWL